MNIYLCSFCGYKISPTLKDGFLLCPNCNRIVDTSLVSAILSAGWVVRKQRINNAKVLKSKFPELSIEILNFIIDNVETGCYDHQEFEKLVKNNLNKINKCSHQMKDSKKNFKQY